MAAGYLSPKRLANFRAAARAAGVGRIHDLVQGALDGRLIGLSDLVEHVPDLVRPAALDGDAGEDDRQGGQRARAAVDAEHVETLAGQPAAVKIGEKALQFGGALGFSLVSKSAAGGLCSYSAPSQGRCKVMGE